MKYLLTATLLWLLWGCEREYSPQSGLMREFHSVPVVNSLLGSGETVDVSLAWSRPAESTKEYEAIADAQVELKQDGQIVFTGRSNLLGRVRTGVTARKGSVYDITVRIQGHPDVTASTTVPGSSSVTATGRLKGTEIHHSYGLVDVSALEAYPGVRALWVSLIAIYDNIEWMNRYSLYTNCPFVDQVNAARDGMDAELKESNMSFDQGFLRLPRSGFGQIIPFTFSSDVFPARVAYDENYQPLNTSYVVQLAVCVLTPSDEYDRYMRSAYKMGQTIGYGSPMQEGTESVYTNVSNGLGIFAGYHRSDFTMDVHNPFRP